METTADELLKIKKGVWIQINPLRDIEQVKELTTKLNAKGEDFVYNDEKTHFNRRMNDLFDLKDNPGYRVETRGRYEDLYFNGKLIAIR